MARAFQQNENDVKSFVGATANDSLSYPNANVNSWKDYTNIPVLSSRAGSSAKLMRFSGKLRKPIRNTH